MKFKIEHEIDGRVRVKFLNGRMTVERADIIQYFFDRMDFTEKVRVNDRTGSIVIKYRGDRERIIYALQRFSYEKVSVPESYMENSGRAIDIYYRDQIIKRVLRRYTKRFFMPKFLRGIFIWYRASKYAFKAIASLKQRKLDVAVLDGTAIMASVLRNDVRTAGSIMFLLGIGDILEEWTRKKSVTDLARSMSLNIPKVWMICDGEEILTDSSDVKEGDKVKVYRGNVIPFDGSVISGDAMVNQASLTGEPLALARSEGDTVYAGTVVEEGEILINVKNKSGSGKFEQIVKMIEETEKLKSSVESKAEHLADHFVPYSFAGTILAYLFTRNMTRALSVLMVDYSCALKLSTPITVLSAIKEAREHDINVKGGKFLEQVAEADTIVFDKTGTLTKARPEVYDIVSFNGMEKDDLLKIAACLEEHFPHSMAKAVVAEAENRGIKHKEMHSKVEYIIAHGIASGIDESRVIIGSHHFVFEDESTYVPEEKLELLKSLPAEYSHLYMAIDGVLAAVILIVDPLRDEAAEVIGKLKKLGISKIVMMTGDSDRTAKAVAKLVGVDEYYSEVLPADKAEFIEKEKAMGRKVIMVGDGLNDSPALSAADCGIAVSDGSELARDISDITIGADNLYAILDLKKLSDKLMIKLGRNYRNIIGINSALILGGVTGLLQPTMSAFLHNSSTIAISINGMNPLLEN